MGKSTMPNTSSSPAWPYSRFERITFTCGYTFDLKFHMQMLKHGRAGVPLEVMGLLLGEFVDDYTV